MRFVVFLLGLLGSALIGFAGVSIIIGGDWLNSIVAMLPQSENLEVPRLRTLGLVPIAYFLTLGAVYGLIGSILALLRCGWQGGVLMLVAVAGPLLLALQTGDFVQLITFILVALLALTALMSFMVRARPASPVY